MLTDRAFYSFLLAIVLVNFLSLYNPIFTGDSALYASISKTMAANNDWVNLFDNGNDWLDKPHFPFWLCAISIKFLGANTVAYKLPSLLFFLVALFYTHQLAKKLYNTAVAKWAVLVLGCSLHVVISNNDVRAEAILVGLVAGGTYYLYQYYTKFSFKNLLLSSVFIAAAIMTKGIFVLLIFYSAIFGNALYHKNFRDIWNIKWLWQFLTIFLFILPELYCLYIQFDIHPEKIVFNKTHTSGIKFFLWDSQFGRFFNTGPIKGNGDNFFFIHTLLWAFAPWCVMAYYLLAQQFWAMFRKKWGLEIICFLGFGLMFLIFSLSKFQLAHYTNILFPFLSIIVGRGIVENVDNKIFRKLSFSTLLIAQGIYILGITLLHLFFEPSEHVSIELIVLVMLLALFVGNLRSFKYAYYYGVASTCLFLMYMNVVFYPSLLKYQSGSEAAFYINKNYDIYDVGFFNQSSYLFTFYCKKPVQYWNINEIRQRCLKHPTAIYTNQAGLDSLIENGLTPSYVKPFADFHITQLNADFINYTTRYRSLDTAFVTLLGEAK